MASKGRLKYNGTVVYPTVSLDNLVASVSGGSASVPTLDSSGKIELAFIPDDIGGGGGGTWVPIVDLGSAATVSVAAGKAYSLSVPASTTRTIKATVTAGKVGKPAFIRIVLASGASITAQTPLILNGTLTANATNNCYVDFRGEQAILTKKDNLT
jgi:hypothetical protein